MHKYITEYIRSAEALIDTDGTDLELLREEFLRKLEFFQHERLIHLIVTLMVVVAMFISFVLIFISDIEGFAVLSLILLVLTAAYLGHYYFLENSVQKMYRIYDRISHKLCENAAENTLVNQK